MKRLGKINLVLMDLHMPLMDGSESALRIRKYEESQGLPKVKIFALTGDEQSDLDD